MNYLNKQRRILTAMTIFGLAMHCSEPARAVDDRFMLDPKTLDQSSTKTEPAAQQPVSKVRIGKQASPPKPITPVKKLKPIAKKTSLAKKSRPTGTSGGRFNNQQAFLDSIKKFWPQLVPSAAQEDAWDESIKTLSSFSLDPNKFPILAAADGGRIVIDVDGKIPQTVKSRLLSFDNGVRIVSERPEKRQYFFRALLAAAKLNSVEEGSRFEFGQDPLLTVNVDYRIENGQENLVSQRLTLLNVKTGAPPMPAPLISFLESKSFQVLEPFAGPPKLSGRRGEIIQVRSKAPSEVVDCLLRNMKIAFQADQSIELFTRQKNGFALSVKADRAFEKNGVKYVVIFSENDPEKLTSSRLLEARNYRIIRLKAMDNLATIAEQVLARLGMPDRYQLHELWPRDERPYAIKLSGIMLPKHESDDKILVTDREIEPLFVDLVESNGFSVVRF